jgi:hypothetical protein
MTRYNTRPRAALYIPDEWSDTADTRALVVHPEAGPRFTGLLDAEGDEIWITPNPIGFVWFD